MTIEHFIEFNITEKLEKGDVLRLYEAVKSALSDKMTTYKDFRVVYEYDEYHKYYIPLTEDLSPEDDELIEKIMETWEEGYSGDYFIETSTDETVIEPDGQDEEVYNKFGLQLKQVVFADDEFVLDEHLPFIALSLAKYQHKVWMDEKLENGWKYSSEYDFTNKQHPLLLPWEQLPKEYQNSNEELVKEFDSILAGLGLAIKNANSNK